jgi:DNA-binding Xre family transcriptional regulator
MTELDLRYNLKSILRERNMTQLDLAQQLNLKPNNLNTRLARGRNCQLSLLESICKVLKVEMERLMYGVKSVETPEYRTNQEEEIMYRFKYEESQDKLIAALEEISFLKDLLAKKDNSQTKKVG